MTSFFLYCIKKMSFVGSPNGTPHDWCRRTMKKNYPEPKKCSICWVSHMFSIWEYRYSYGICFGTVYALQNSTPNILSFLFSVHTRRVEIGHILSRRSWLYLFICIISNHKWPYVSQWLLMGIDTTTPGEYHGRIWNIMDANCRRYGTQPWFPVPKMFHIHGGFSVSLYVNLLQGSHQSKWYNQWDIQMDDNDHPWPKMCVFCWLHVMTISLFGHITNATVVYESWLNMTNISQFRC